MAAATVAPAASSSAGRQWPSTSRVIEMDACPSRLETTVIGMPNARCDEGTRLAEQLFTELFGVEEAGSG